MFKKIGITLAALLLSVSVFANQEDVKITASFVAEPGTMEIRDDVCLWCWRWGGRR